MAKRSWRNGSWEQWRTDHQALEELRKRRRERTGDYSRRRFQAPVLATGAIKAERLPSLESELIGNTSQE